MAADTNGMPSWMKVVTLLGLPTFLLLWFLGAFDTFLPSPVTAALKTHDDKTIRIQRLICEGLWKESQMMRAECNR